VLSIQQLSGDDADRLINEQLHIAGWTQERRSRFKDAFQDELSNNPLQFAALPPRKRSYYLVNHDGRAEALCGIDYRRGSDTVKISSFARLIAKDRATAQGWQYLHAIIEQVLLPSRRIAAAFASIDTPGGAKVFAALKSRHGTGYTIVIRGRFAHIILKRSGSHDTPP
jgi:hypothetical protein